MEASAFCFDKAAMLGPGAGEFVFFKPALAWFHRFPNASPPFAAGFAAGVAVLLAGREDVVFEATGTEVK